MTIDENLVRRLLVSQFPQWADLPIAPVESMGTVNVLYRVGDEVCVRLPRVKLWAWQDAAALTTYHGLLKRLAPDLPAPIPMPVAERSPGEGYPFPWAVHRWLAGRVPDDRDADSSSLAADLARFVTALHQIHCTGSAPSGRGTTITEPNEYVAGLIDGVRGLVDTDAVSEVLIESLRAPAHEGPPVWVHGDLLPGNLLVDDGRLSAVLDFEAIGYGDPAVDLIPAWSVLNEATREVFRSHLDVDDATWLRARGWALLIALPIIPYYPKTNPGFVAMAMRMIKAIVSEHRRPTQRGASTIDRWVVRQRVADQDGRMSGDVASLLRRAADYLDQLGPAYLDSLTVRRDATGEAEHFELAADFDRSNMRLDLDYLDPREGAPSDDDGPLDAEKAFMVALAEELGAELVVDLGCGTGRLARELAAHRRVIGVDPSPPSMAAARNHPDAERVTWILGVAADVGTPDADLIVMTGNVPLAIRDDDEWDTTLQAAHAALRLGGRLAFGVHNPEARVWEQWRDVYGVDVVAVSDGRVDVQGTIEFGPDEVLYASSEYRFRTLDELHDSLQRAGFVVERTFGDGDGSPLTPSSPQIVLVAERTLGTEATR